jgi:hypothetical protein
MQPFDCLAGACKNDPTSSNRQPISTRSRPPAERLTDREPGSRGFVLMTPVERSDPSDAGRGAGRRPGQRGARLPLSEGHRRSRSRRSQGRSGGRPPPGTGAWPGPIVLPGRRRCTGSCASRRRSRMCQRSPRRSPRPGARGVRVREETWRGCRACAYSLSISLASSGGIVVGVRADLPSLRGVVIAVGADLAPLGGVEGMSVERLAGRVGPISVKGRPLFAFGVVWLEVKSNGGCDGVCRLGGSVVGRFELLSGRRG